MTEGLKTAHQALDTVELWARMHASGPEFSRKQAELVKTLRDYAEAQRNLKQEGAGFIDKVADLVESF